jgi:peptidoglycan hydrolase-like protein with peptidoglycan-binding domain
VALLGKDVSQASAGSGPAVTPAVTVSPTAAPSPSATPTLTTTPSPKKKAASTSASPSTGPTAQVDPATLDIRSDSCPATLSSGASGDCVKALQTLLGGWGLHTAVEGTFGPQTLSAVKVFQTEAGILADGKVDTRTKNYLYSAPRGPVLAGTLTVTEQVNGVDQARCLESGSGRVGRKVQVWECDSSLGQQWALHRVPGRADQYIVVAQAGHGCLDADAGTAGTNGQLIQGPTCTGLIAQRWKLGDRKASGARTLISVPDGFCLDADAGTNGTNGQKVQGWGCAGTAPQDWTWA